MRKVNRFRRVLFGGLILVLFLVIGLVYWFIPFESKVAFNLDFGLGSFGHGVLALVTVLVGVVLFVLSLTTSLIERVDRVGRKYWFVFLLFDVVKWVALVLVGAWLVGVGGGAVQTVIG